MKKKIGEMLIEASLIQQEELDKALKIQDSVGGRLGGVLVRIGAISEDSLIQILSQQLGIPVLIPEISLPDDPSIFSFLSSSDIQFDWFIDQAVIIWDMGNNQLGVTARDIMAESIPETLAYFYPEMSLQWHLSRTQDLDKLLDFMRKEKAVEALFSGDENKQLRELAEEAPVIELVNNIMAQAIDSESSDIHVEPSEETFAIRFRVDGVLQTKLVQPIERFPAVASRIKLISGIDIAERRLPQDGRITTRVSGKEMDIRVSTAPGVFGESIVMRLLPKERDELSLELLGMEQDHLLMMRSWLSQSNGIVLVTGPTGSGKSTTLYGSLEDINNGKNKIITVEDPVEYQVKGITQLQAHAEIGYTFAKALRAILRQDPDIIMIGEIRDLETAEIAIQSALTGHLVLSTLHTNDSISSFTRLTDMGVEPFLIATPVRGVQAQRLVRKVCVHCCEPYVPSESILAEMARLPQELVGDSWVKAVGCSHCHQQGYRGRMGVYELAEMTPQLQDMIVSGASVNEMRRVATESGFRTLYQDGLIKASQGKTTLEEVLRATRSD